MSYLELKFTLYGKLTDETEHFHQKYDGFCYTTNLERIFTN